MAENKKELSFRDIIANDEDTKEEGAGLRSQNIREKLAKTYFANSAQATAKPHPARPTPPVVKKPKKQLYAARNIYPFIFLIAVSIFMLITLLSYPGKKSSSEPDTKKLNQSPVLSAAPLAATTDLLLVDDFNQESKINKLGGYFGTFTLTPDDQEQYCRLSFDKENKIGFSGNSLRLDYSLESVGSTSNGFWLSLANLDATKYTGIDFFIKGDQDAGYPASLKLQLKNATQSGTYILNNTDSRWKRVYLPFKDFAGLKDLDHLLKFLIIFDKQKTAPERGTVYIDNLQFVNR